VRGSRRPPSRAERRLIALFFALVALPFLAIFPYFAGTNNPNENTRTFMTMAIVEEGTFALDKIVARQGWTNDMARVKGKDGVYRYYSVKGPANGYMGVLPYAVFLKVAPVLKIEVPTASSSVPARIHWLRMSTWVIRLFSVSLPCFLFLVWLERYLRGFSSDVVLRLTAVAAAGIGTNYLGYALMNVSHSLFAVSSFLAFGLTEQELRTRADRRDRRFVIAFLVGLCAGWTTMLEYHALPLSVVLTIYAFAVFRSPRGFAGIALGGAVCIALVMFYQDRQFGNPLTPGHLNVENPLWAEEHKRGLFGMIMPTEESVRGLSLPAGSGFFGMSPFNWLAFLAAPFVVMPAMSSLRERKLMRVTTFVWMTAMAALWFAACGAIEWRAGWTLGPRRLGAAAPFFALGAVTALEWFASKGALNRAVARGVAIGSAFSGVVAVGLVGIVYNTLPEHILRPFAHFALPLLRAGFVPHHVFEWFGLDGIGPWYFVAAALLLAALLPLFIRGRESLAHHAARVVVACAVFAACFRPQLQTPDDTEVGAREPNVAGWMSGWEPKGRDRITKMRETAERYGTRRACPWYRLADLERAVHLDAQARRDAARAGGPRENCPPLRF
jgi:hypothetical protein